MKNYICRIAAIEWEDYAAYGAVIESDSKRTHQLVEVKKDETVKRMELYALIACLKATPINHIVTILSPSTYIINPFNNNWIQKWQKDGIGERPNGDLWIEIVDLIKNRDVQWFKGKTVSVAEAKDLAQKAARRGNLSV